MNRGLLCAPVWCKFLPSRPVMIAEPVGVGEMAVAKNLGKRGTLHSASCLSAAGHTVGAAEFALLGKPW